MQDPFCHSSSVAVARPAEAAFTLMSDGLQQGRWAWGSADRREAAPGLFLGTSVFTGQRKYVRLNADPARLLVDYEIGPSPDALSFRNMSRVIPGPVLGLAGGTSVVTLLTWRIASQSDADWTEFCCIHEAEMFLIRGLLER